EKVLSEAFTKAGRQASYLWLAQGQLQITDENYEDAIESFDQGIRQSDGNPDLLIELYGAKADGYMSQGNELRAIQTLDEFADNAGMPIDLRSEALLQKAMIMRDSGRKRRATLVENRAVEMADSPEQRAETQRLVNRLRKKYGS
ncbi:MAG: hypothetical protein AAGA30_16940, partial [Planctomycetota bacterium]